MDLADRPMRELLALTATWVDESHPDHLTLASFAETAALLGGFERARRVAESAGSDDEALQEADQRHDRYALGIHKVLEGLELLAEEPAESQRYQVLRQALFPSGADLVDAPYPEEADHGVRRAVALTRGMRGELARIAVAGRDLGAYVDALQKASRHLAELLAPSSKKSQRAAHHALVRHVRAILQNLDIAPATVGQRLQIRAPFEATPPRLSRPPAPG